MDIDHSLIKIMIERIADFFLYMSDNKERRLYYQAPITYTAPYAYQHSSIRDVATVCDILDLIQFFQKQKWNLSPNAESIFSDIVKNTLEDYHTLYQKEQFLELPEGNIGDLGFYLLALNKCDTIFPSHLPQNWDQTYLRLINRIIDRQNEDGSFDIFFDASLKPYEKSSEAFYLPEALIGLINCIKVSDQVESTIQKAMTYVCQEENRKRHLSSDTAIFYCNWQFQLLFHWMKSKETKNSFSLEKSHLVALLDALKMTRFANTSFDHLNATVEVACYMEGLTHAYQSFQMMNQSGSYEGWFQEQISRSLEFLSTVQERHLGRVCGGFVHSLNSHEARVDVAGHVFGGLKLLPG